jgi:N-formylglutamate amidohydrolase
MTDHFTHALFAEPNNDSNVVRAPVSRLVVDVERFSDDTQESMAKRGMGAVYEVTSHLASLRRSLTQDERLMLMKNWYRPHHERLEARVTNCIDRYGKCFVLDAHSFPNAPLPYEMAEPATVRPDICIGTDPFHTPPELAKAFVEAFNEHGWTVAVNDPFAGALVPASRYGRDSRVAAVMVEINRDLYLDAPSATPKVDFAQVASQIRTCCANALAKYEDAT